jgi:hypothetical protein
LAKASPNLGLTLARIKPELTHITNNLNAGVKVLAKLGLRLRHLALQVRLQRLQRRHVLL